MTPLRIFMMCALLLGCTPPKDRPMAVDGVGSGPVGDAPRREMGSGRLRTAERLAFARHESRRPSLGSGPAHLGDVACGDRMRLNQPTCPFRCDTNSVGQIRTASPYNGTAWIKGSLRFQKQMRQRPFDKSDLNQNGWTCCASGVQIGYRLAKAPSFRRALTLSTTAGRTACSTR